MSEKDQNKSIELESGTYEILQKRLKEQSESLLKGIDKLNEERKEVFGSIETKLIGSERVTTENNCEARDIFSFGKNLFLFGYNVHIGLKSETNVSDVFSLYAFDQKKQEFQAQDLSILKNAEFETDFANLYKYYKDTVFVKFAPIGPYLHMVFRIGKSVTDIKTFKWLIKGDKFTYEGNRSDSEYKFPSQQEFTWKKATRDDQVDGKFPHISVQDKVFVETMNGDLTIKVENNTDTGKGIYSEKVEEKDQTLDDLELYYSAVGHLILMKIRPFKENAYRYVVFNSKLNTAVRIDSIQNACLLLPDDHGLIFAEGYYLHNGEYKVFDLDLKDMVFERKLQSPNGEDYLYVFYNRESGTYVLLSYNIIEQAVLTPIIASGYSLFENGELIFFKDDQEQKKHHMIQIWQTPYLDHNIEIGKNKDSKLFKIGNKDVVSVISELKEVIKLINREDVYENLYSDLVKRSVDLMDSYHWLQKETEYGIIAPLKTIRETGETAISEFDKVKSLKRIALEKIEEVAKAADEIIRKSKNTRSSQIMDYVNVLAGIRTIRGEVISMREVRYVDLEKVEKIEIDLKEQYDKTSGDTVNFLMKESALDPYKTKIDKLFQDIEGLKKVADAEVLEQDIQTTGKNLEMLIEIVSNLKIKDATKTAAIVNNISEIYSNINKLTAGLKSKKKSLLAVEGKAEFAAQINLLEQAVLNYSEVSDTPEKCDEYSNKLMLMLEEMEGRFVDFEEFTDKINEKREDVYALFESRKVQLIEQRNKRANKLMESAARILKGVKSRLLTMKSVEEINGFLASDLMVDKAKSIVDDLRQLGDTVKSDDVDGQLKALKEEAIRQLRDKQDLFQGGEDLISFGNHKFFVNKLDLDLTLVQKTGGLYFHITGTNFFELIENEELNGFQDQWNRDLISENDATYRCEYLAYSIMRSKGINFLITQSDEELLQIIASEMSVRLDEGYVKGIHDADTLLILKAILHFEQSSDLLKYSSKVRACANLFWQLTPEEIKVRMDHQLKGAGLILQVFPDSSDFNYLLEEIRVVFGHLNESLHLLDEYQLNRACQYFFEEFAQNSDFIISGQAHKLAEDFKAHLKKSKKEGAYSKSQKNLHDDAVARFNQNLKWLSSFDKEAHCHEEAAVLLTYDQTLATRLVHADLELEIDGLLGEHRKIEEKKMVLNYVDFLERLGDFDSGKERFKAFRKLKTDLLNAYKEELRLNEFKPRVLSSFVRNKLIDKVYLPLIGANLAKQIGGAGDEKRTDLMGMLLLISPPGYGKTTLMEYIASRLGLVFLKVNGPAIGHDVKSLDPKDATTSAAAEELKKLNLGFEMGDNVMLYLDDIQHCNPEFLQKFISLCDAQRKVEGVYKGKPKTYDFRGKKVCVVMAGNPYTESGDKFRIPDMLANRADIYNLGDIIGGNADVFELSYIENSVTSNSLLNKLASKSRADLLKMVGMINSGNKGDVDFEQTYSPEELNDYMSLLQKVLYVQSIVLKANQEYIYSAGQEEVYRKEPSFKLQGSYRDMNKMVEKLQPIMNEKELETVVVSHYENESQTLTTGAEANYLKLLNMLELQDETQKSRWEEIKEEFLKRQKLKGYGDENSAKMIAQMQGISDSINGLNMGSKGALSQKDFERLIESIRAISKVMIEEKKGGEKKGNLKT
ncbi:MAG: DNA repair ATPase [Crocinitomicaceae bacterium]|nr:DNA repair ATPase [Crocinitomicaceae bacterium]